jgi:hypothetical protein
MNRNLIFLALTAGVFVAGSSVPAFSATYGPAQNIHYDDDRSVDKKMDVIRKKLMLSPTQLFAVQTTLNDQAIKMDLLKKEILEARKKIIDDTDSAMIGILNPQEQEKYKKIKSDIIGKPEGDGK